MTGTFARRLVRLERGADAGWEAYWGLPPDRWPDAALLAFLGLPVNASDAELTSAIEQRLAALSASTDTNARQSGREETMDSSVETYGTAASMEQKRR